MFTGIIKKTSKIKNIKTQGGSFVVEIQNNLGKIKLGESITVNGVCSTVKKTGWPRLRSFLIYLNNGAILFLRPGFFLRLRLFLLRSKLSSYAIKHGVKE